VRGNFGLEGENRPYQAVELMEHVKSVLCELAIS
jgi:hypothetical protein